MYKEQGIALYDIQKDGHLNGVFCNPGTKGQVFTETARRNPEKDDSEKGEFYDCFYFDIHTVECRCVLYLKNTNGTIKAKWVDLNGKIFFEGIGFQMNERQIAITYQNAWI